MSSVLKRAGMRQRTKLRPACNSSRYLTDDSLKIFSNISVSYSAFKNTKAAWEGYAEGLESIAVEFEKAEEEMKKVKKRFNLQAAFEDLEKRQKIFNDSKNTIETMFANIQHNYDVMTMTLPEDKKDFVKKEVKAVQV